MSAFLVGVADAEEVLAALAAGADAVDAAGAPLAVPGPESVDLVRTIVEAVGGRRPVGALIDAMVDHPPTEPAALAATAGALAATGIRSLKIGLRPGERRESLIRALSPLAGGVRLFAVFFADREPGDWPLAMLRDAGFAGAMLDVADPATGGLLDHLGMVEIMAFIAACRDKNLLAGLSGALEPPDIPRLLPLGADLIGFGNGLPKAVLRELRALIPLIPDALMSKAPATVADAPDPPAKTSIDRIFVHDFILPVSIGLYARERKKPQTVRFNVDVEVSRAAGVPRALSDILSYDVIMDAIALIVARAHVPLVETLAETIAAEILAHPRARRVIVRIEKLDVGPAHVGVEVIRER